MPALIGPIEIHISATGEFSVLSASISVDHKRIQIAHDPAAILTDEFTTLLSSFLELLHAKPE